MYTIIGQKYICIMDLVYEAQFAQMGQLVSSLIRECIDLWTKISGNWKVHFRLLLAKSYVFQHVFNCYFPNRTSLFFCMNYHFTLHWEMQWVENSLQQNMKIQDISYEQVFIKYEFAKKPLIGLPFIVTTKRKKCTQT